MKLKFSFRGSLWPIRKDKNNHTNGTQVVNGRWAAALIVLWVVIFLLVKSHLLPHYK